MRPNSTLFCSLSSGILASHQALFDTVCSSDTCKCAVPSACDLAQQQSHGMLVSTTGALTGPAIAMQETALPGQAPGLCLENMLNDVGI